MTIVADEPPGQFLNEILHSLIYDLRTPMGQVLEALRRMQGETGSQPDRDYRDYRALENIAVATLEISERLLSVIDALLEILRSGKLRPTLSACALAALAGAAIEAVQPRMSKPHIRLINAIAPDFAPLFADRHLITQTLIALLESRLAQPPDSGELRLIADELSINATRLARVSLVDAREGTAPAAADVAQLFTEPLYKTLRRKGASGLVLARLVVLAHGGTIDAVPHNGSGVSIRFTLPITALPPETLELDVLAAAANSADTPSG